MARKLLIALGLLALVAWGAFYVYLNALACAFSGPSGSQNCRTKWPWQLHGEDLVLLVLVPGGIIALIFLFAWLAGPGRPRP